jgi:hypothetical protein
MTVWFAIPSKRPPDEANAVLAQWHRQGYRVAVYRDEGDPDVAAQLIINGRYPGYASATNALCREIIRLDPEAQWIVIGGDDVLPDPTQTAEAIGAQCSEHFGGTFGVMQPTGDRWGECAGSAPPDRVCCYPFLGREFCRRMYGGKGPMHDGFHHMFVDEELHHVATKLGVLWHRRDLTHTHQHWMRDGKQMPEFLREANSPQHWQKSQLLFKARLHAGFPGHHPIAL